MRGACSQSWRTKKVIVELEGVDYLIPHLSSTDWVTQMYAAAAIQNMCQNIEFILQEFDHVVTKPKLEDDDELKDTRRTGTHEFVRSKTHQ